MNNNWDISSSFLKLSLTISLLIPLNGHTASYKDIVKKNLDKFITEYSENCPLHYSDIRCYELDLEIKINKSILDEDIEAASRYTQQRDKIKNNNIISNQISKNSVNNIYKNKNTNQISKQNQPPACLSVKPISKTDAIYIRFEIKNECAVERIASICVRVGYGPDWQALEQKASIVEGKQTWYEPFINLDSENYSYIWRECNPDNGEIDFYTCQPKCPAKSDMPPQNDAAQQVSQSQSPKPTENDRNNVQCIYTRDLSGNSFLEFELVNTCQEERIASVCVRTGDGPDSEALQRKSIRVKGKSSTKEPFPNLDRLPYKFLVTDCMTNNGEADSISCPITCPGKSGSLTPNIATNQNSQADISTSASSASNRNTSTTTNKNYSSTQPGQTLIHDLSRDKYIRDLIFNSDESTRIGKNVMTKNHSVYINEFANHIRNVFKTHGCPQSYQKYVDRGNVIGCYSPIRGGRDFLCDLGNDALHVWACEGGSAELFGIAQRRGPLANIKQINNPYPSGDLMKECAKLSQQGLNTTDTKELLRIADELKKCQSK